MTMQRMVLALVGVMALCWAGGAAAQEERTATFGTGEGSTRIKAHRLDFDYTRRTVVFDGDVVVEDPRVTIMAEQITMLLSTNNEPEVITAVENVRIEQDMRKVQPPAGSEAAVPATGAEFRRATCQRATYSVRSGLLVLTGRPKVMQGASTMTGSRIIFSRDDDKVKCEDAQLQIVPGEGGFQGIMAPKK